MGGFGVRRGLRPGLLCSAALLHLDWGTARGISKRRRGGGAGGPARFLNIGRRRRQGWLKAAAGPCRGGKVRPGDVLGRAAAVAHPAPRPSPSTHPPHLRRRRCKTPTRRETPTAARNSGGGAKLRRLASRAARPGRSTRPAARRPPPAPWPSGCLAFSVSLSKPRSNYDW